MRQTLLLALVLCGLATTVAAAPPANELRPGHWINRSAKNILGAGSDEIVTLSRSSGRWQIAFTGVRYYSVNDHHSPTRGERGPFDVMLDHGILSYTEGAQVRRFTYAVLDTGLALPAVRQVDAAHWAFESPRLRADFRSAADPEKVPFGSATFTPRDEQKVTQAYVLEAGEYRPPLGRSLRVLRFLEQSREGPLREQYRIEWDDADVPHLHGRSEAGYYQDRQYRAMSPAEWEKVQSLDPEPPRAQR